MQPLKYQALKSEQRKSIILTIAEGLNKIDSKKFPRIYNTFKAGNNKKNQLLNLIIEQLYSNNMNLENCFLALEENI